MSSLTSPSTTSTPSGLNTQIAQTAFNAAQNLYNTPYTPYQGSGVAAFTPAQLQAQRMITSGGLNNLGSVPLNQAIAEATRASNYSPTTVTAPDLGRAAQLNLGNLGFSASSYAGAELDPITQMLAAQLGPAYLAQAASVDRGSVQDVYGQQGAQYMSAYQNPWDTQVVDTTLADLDRARRMMLIGQEDAALGSGAYGGSRHGVADSLTNEAALRQAATTAAGLRQTGFNTAANLGMTDANRMLQASLANQGVDLSAATANAGFGQQTALANQNAQNDFLQANAGFQQQANQANAGWSNDRNLAQGQLSNQAGIASMQAANAAAQANAQMKLQAMMANQDAKNTFALKSGDMALTAGMANQSAGLAGANLGLSAANTLSNLSTQQRSNYLQNVAALDTVGTQQQANNQALRDFDYQQWLYDQNDPYRRLQALNSVSGPGGGTVTQNPSTLANIGQGVNILSPFLSLFD